MATTGVGYPEHAPVPTGLKCKMVTLGTKSSIKLSSQFRQLYYIKQNEWYLVL
jgi:hypothetical protein